jgi:CRP/FNR family transcriptional regulator
MTTTKKKRPRADKPSVFSRFALFWGLPALALRHLERTSRVEEFPRGHQFFLPGDSGYALFLLEKGAVRTYRTAGRKKLIIADLESPGVFGEMGCVGERVYHCTAEAIDPSRIRIISRVDMEFLLAKYPAVARRLLDLVGQRFFHLLVDLESTSSRHLISRIAGLLLRRAEGDTVRDLTHKEIAEHLHVYRESVTEALGELRKAGIVSIDRKQIRILDGARLQRASRE